MPEPIPTLEQESQEAVLAILALSSGVQATALNQAVQYVQAFATRRRDAGKAEACNQLELLMIESQQQVRHTTAQRCAEIALLADGGADPVGQGQRIATAIRKEFGLTEES